MILLKELWEAERELAVAALRLAQSQDVLRLVTQERENIQAALAGAHRADRT